MMTRRDRIGGAVAALLWQALILYGLYLGLVVLPGQRAADSAMVYITPIAPPAAVPERRPTHVARPRARAAPPAPVARSTAIVVPPPVLPPIMVPPIVAAPVAGTGAAANSGGADAGAGTGAAGAGEGSGAGDDGDGNGDGGTPAEWLRGRIRDRDYPYEAIIGHIEGALVARYVIDTDGRVSACTILKSSGSPILDSTVCRLVQQRFRYRPARDTSGQQVPDVLIEEHAWVIEKPGEGEAGPPAAGADGPGPR